MKKQLCKKSISPIIDVDVYIHYIDSSGNDLFTNGANGYIPSSIRLYYIKNKQRQLVYTAPTQALMLDCPYGFSF